MVSSDEPADGSPIEAALLRWIWRDSPVPLPTELISAALGLPESDVHRAAISLLDRGEVGTTADGWWTVPEHHRLRPPPTHADQKPHEPLTDYKRLCAYLEIVAARLAAMIGRDAGSVNPSSGVDTPTLQLAATYRITVPALVHVLEITGEPTRAVVLAMRWWVIADQVSDAASEPWLATLSTAGYDAAITARSARLAAQVLDARAQCACRMADWPSAERAWAYACLEWRRSGRPANSIPYLEALLWLYLFRGRGLDALDTLYDLVRTHEHEGAYDELCWALVRLGTLMLSRGRADASVEHFARASTLLRAGEAGAVGAGAVLPPADVDILLGRALWSLGDTGGARKAWRRAMSRLVDASDRRADAVRTMLSLEQGAEPPDEPPLAAIITDDPDAIGPRPGAPSLFPSAPT